MDGTKGARARAHPRAQHEHWLARLPVGQLQPALEHRVDLVREVLVLVVLALRKISNLGPQVGPLLHEDRPELLLHPQSIIDERAHGPHLRALLGHPLAQANRFGEQLFDLKADGVSRRGEDGGWSIAAGFAARPAPRRRTW